MDKSIDPRGEGKPQILREMINSTLLKPSLNSNSYKYQALDSNTLNKQIQLNISSQFIIDYMVEPKRTNIRNVEYFFANLNVKIQLKLTLFQVLLPQQEEFLKACFVCEN